MTEVTTDLPQVEVISTIGELNEAAAGLQKAANRLYARMREFEGVEGVGTQYAIAVQDELTQIYNDAIDDRKRPPAEDIRGAMAERAVRLEQPELYRKWREGKTEIDALRIWISGIRASISARQSILKGEKG